MRCTLATLLVTAALLSWPGLAAAQETVQWRNDYNTARKEAEKKGLPLVIDFGTENCYWCKRLDEDTFRDPAVVKMMNEKFIPLKIDANQEPQLAKLLNIARYPTVILAGPDGKILGTLEGFQDATRFYGDMQRALAAVSNPEWMMRDYQMATKAVADHDCARAVALLKAIVEDGKNRPVQVNAGLLLKQVEQQAAGELAQAKQMIDKGKTHEASDMLTRLVKDCAGTQAAKEASYMLTSLAKTPEVRGQQRAARAQELLAHAKEDYRTEQWLWCLDRCELLTSSYGDLPEAAEALQMANTIRSNPEWMTKACENMTARLGDMYLGLADTWLQKGQPQQAMLCLERVVRNFPNTRHAEMAQYRLNQLQGVPTQPAGFKK
jgi:thioredoxin-like negative regulator of GroEL